jgi:hypothetical protein
MRTAQFGNLAWNWRMTLGRISWQAVVLAPIRSRLVDEAAAHVALQGLDGVADRGLGEAHLGRRCGEAAPPGERHEGVELATVD